MGAKRIKIYGTVQGVYFRASCKNEAIRLGISGFVKNMKDRSVYTEAQGENLDKFIEWCACGPSSAEVERLDVEDIPEFALDSFEIRYD